MNLLPSIIILPTVTQINMVITLTFAHTVYNSWNYEWFLALSHTFAVHRKHYQEYHHILDKIVFVSFLNLIYCLYLLNTIYI